MTAEPADKVTMEVPVVPARGPSSSPWWRRRWVIPGAAVILIAGVVLALVDPFANANTPSSVADNAAPTGLATVQERPLSSQDQVSGTLGDANTYDVTIPVGTSGASLTQDQSATQAAQAKVAADQLALSNARTLEGTQAAAQVDQAQAAVTNDDETLAAAQQQLSADQQLGCPASSSATVTTPLNPGSSSGNGGGSGSNTGGGSNNGGGGSNTSNSANVIAAAAGSTGAPAATTGSASQVTSTTAIVSGSVDPDGASTSYVFDYGTTSALGQSTPSSSAGAGTDAVTVTAQLSGLTPDSTYDVALVATNAAGTTVGATETFSTAQSSCVSQQQVVSDDSTVDAAAHATLAAAQGTGGATVAQDEQQLSSDESVAATDAAALAVAQQQATDVPSAASPDPTITSLPTAGDVVRQGQRVYGVDGQPVTLLYGTTTPWRSLALGDADGPDITELQQNLIALGFGAGLSADPHFSAATAAAVKAWQGSLGVAETGVVDLGSVLVEAGPIKVDAVSGSVGQAVQPGAAVLQASSTERQVVINLDATQQSEVASGDHVTITLPDNAVTDGVVTSVGTIATCPAGSGSGSGGGGGAGAASSTGSSTTSPSSSGSGVCTSSSGATSPPTLTVDVAPNDPAATGSLDQAPVQVAITTASAKRALVVPVSALLALADGGYALEVVAAGGTHHLEAVNLGLFDDANGLVQVSGAEVQRGQRVVVPAAP